jgi:O-antigen/teichoic acid export membrane protein
VRSAIATGARWTRGPIARGSIVSFGIRIAGLGITLVQAAVMARLLGAEGYGRVATAISFAQVAATVIQLGLGPLAVRDVSRRIAAGDTAGARRFFLRSVTIVGALSAISAGAPALVLATKGSTLGAFESAILIGGMITAPFAFILLLRGIAQGAGNVALAQWPGEVLRPAVLVAVLLTGLAAGFHFSPPAVLAAIFLVAGGAAAVAGVLTWRLLAALPEGSEGTVQPAGNMLRNAMPFLGIAIVGVLQSEIATLMLSALATSEQVGLYQPVSRLSPLIALPMNAVAMSYTPRFAELWQRGLHDRARAVTHSFTLVTFTAGLAIFAVLALFAPLILRLFGPDFAPAADLLRLQAAGQLFMAACGPAGEVITMAGRSRDALVALAGGVIIQALAGAALIPAHGALGATVAAIAGTVVSWLFMAVWARRASGFDPSVITAVLDLQAARQSHSETRHG